MQANNVEFNSELNIVEPHSDKVASRAGAALLYPTFDTKVHKLVQIFENVEHQIQ